MDILSTLYGAPNVLLLANNVSVNNNASEASIFSVSVPAGSMGANGLVWFDVKGRLFNNSGAGRTITLRFKFGSTTFAFTTASYTATTFSRGFSLDASLQNTNNASAQLFNASFRLGAAPVDGGSIASTAYVLNGELYGASAEATSSAKTLELTAQHSAANANLTAYFDRIAVYLLPKT